MISEALRLMRVFHDLKQFELAEKLNISKSYLSEIESGVKSPTLDLLDKYSQEFDIPVSSILFFAEEIPNAKKGDKTRLSVASGIVRLLKFIESRADVTAA